MQVHCPFLSSSVILNIECESFTDHWTTAIPGERGDMNKNLRAALSRCDEAETSLIIPFCESAFNTHIKKHNAAHNCGKAPESDLCNSLKSKLIHLKKTFYKSLNGLFQG